MAIFRVQLKDPDGFYEGLCEAASESVKAVDGVDDDERKTLADRRREQLDSVLEMWVEYGEYVTLEFDTEARTARVLTLAEAR